MGYITLIAVSAIAYLFIGFLIARSYGDKINELEKEVIREWKEEFSMWWVGFWTMLMFFLWPLLWPYEYYTDFRQWRVPYYRISDQY